MTTPTNAAGDGVQELVRQRDQLRAWIARLDEVQTAAPGRVTERVRADYQDRLRRVTEDLAAHGEEIARALEQSRADLAAAEERHAHAADALEEQRLRHLIGELDAGAWEQARLPLEGEVTSAEQAVAHARGEVERLSALAGDVGGAAGEPEEEPAAPAEAPAAEPPPPGEQDAGAFTSADVDEYEPTFAYADEPAEEAAPTPPSGRGPGGTPVSGEELAAWISEVEAEETAPEQPAAATPDAAPSEGGEGWDPFANEFGGESPPASDVPRSPETTAPAAEQEPAETTQELPWLNAIDGGAAGSWADAEHHDDLAFLENLDAPPPPAAPVEGGELADDDLAFLEELDRAISGGGGGGSRPEPPAETPTFSGGSGDGFGAVQPPEGAPEQRKRGEALLCKECGAINEPQAWYCEICGSEL